MNDNSPKQYNIECLEDIHDLIIMNKYEERKANNEVEYIYIFWRDERSTWYIEIIAKNKYWFKFIFLTTFN